MTKENFPRIGQRIIKSAVGVFICYIIYYLRGYNGIPFYSMLAVLWCIQPYTGKTHQMALQRISGTLIGAVYGLLAIVVEIYILDIYSEFAGFFINALLIIPVLYTTVVLHKQNASYFSCVVYLSIAVNHMTDLNPYIFVFNRVLDTFIGIAVGLAVNHAGLPRKKLKNCLFVCELDDMLNPVKDELSSYSKFEINRLIEDGIQFTISTKRTPASLIKSLNGVNIKLPVIAMDGAVLYDLKENTYLKAYVISHNSCRKIVDLIRSEGMNCFINALYDDTLVIYYNKLENEAEKDIFKKLKPSVYRNYVQKEPTKQSRTIYIMLIDKTEKIESFYNKLDSLKYTERFKILHYKSDDYRGYSYIKIYNKNANSYDMMQNLMNIRQLTDKQFIGLDSKQNNNLDGIVKLLKKSYEPFSIR